MPDELIVLGSSSSVPTRRRFPSAYALKVTSKLFLLDCGAPVSSLLYDHELDPIDVRAVFLSHWHMDHVANLGLLLTQNHRRKRPRALNIYGPKGTRGKVERLLADSFIILDNLSYDLKVTNIKPGKSYKEALLKVKFFETQHLEKLKYKTNFGRKAVACGMVIQGPGWRIVYSGDLTSPQELSPYVEGCDLLVHEMSEHRPEEVAEFAAAANIPHVLITHLNLDYDEAPEKIRAAFANRYDGDLMIAEDGMRLKLDQVRQKRSLEVKLSGSNGNHPEIENSLTSAFTPKPPDVKSALHQDDFLHVLQQDFNLSRYYSRQLLKVAEEILVKHTHSMVHSGQIRFKAHPASSGNPTAPPEAECIEVILTFNAGQEDIEVKRRERAVGLRRGRILRILEEALDQGALLSEEDLADVLGVDLSTVKQDLQTLAAEGHSIYTQEQFVPDNPGLSHCAGAVEKWLDGVADDQIIRWLHSSLAALEKILNEFLQVVLAHKQDIAPKEIAGGSEISERVVKDYLQVYAATKASSTRQTKLTQKLEQVRLNW